MNMFLCMCVCKKKVAREKLDVSKNQTFMTGFQLYFNIFAGMGFHLFFQPPLVVDEGRTDAWLWRMYMMVWHYVVYVYCIAT